LDNPKDLLFSWFCLHTLSFSLLFIVLFSDPSVQFISKGLTIGMIHSFRSTSFNTA
ncbi:MAG: hypothetical protein ACI9EP_000610, partial [Oceanospirillaceae bacterium]